jgi:hypothetical protein
MEIVKNRTEYLERLKTIIKPDAVCMEIGVDTGSFSSMILEYLNPKSLILVDPFENMTDPISKQDYYPNWSQRTVYSDEFCLNHVQTKFEKEINESRVIIDRNLSTNAVYNYSDESFDFIYIDACHLYESVKWDMENFIKKIKKGGYLGGHDYFNHPSFGVIQAVDEFCLEYGYEIILLVDESGLGDWLLSPKK